MPWEKILLMKTIHIKVDGWAAVTEAGRSRGRQDKGCKTNMRVRIKRTSKQVNKGREADKNCIVLLRFGFSHSNKQVLSSCAVSLACVCVCMCVREPGRHPHTRRNAHHDRRCENKGIHALTRGAREGCLCTCLSGRACCSTRRRNKRAGYCSTAGAPALMGVGGWRSGLGGSVATGR